MENFITITNSTQLLSAFYFRLVPAVLNNVSDKILLCKNSTVGFNFVQLLQLASVNSVYVNSDAHLFIS